MNSPHIHTSSTRIPRRSFLRGLGVTLALPALDCMTPVFARTAEAPRRMLAIVNNIGVLPKHFFPQGTGRNYEASPLLSILAPQRVGEVHPPHPGHRAQPRGVQRVEGPGEGSGTFATSASNVQSQPYSRLYSAP